MSELRESGDYTREIFRTELPVIDSSYLPDNIRVNFYFSDHVIGDGLEAARPLIEAADVLIPEGCGWSADNLSVYQANANGNKKVRDMMIESASLTPSSSFALKEIELIHDTKKRIAFIDASSVQLQQFKLDLDQPITSSNFEELLDATASLSAAMAQESLARDAFMVQNLGSLACKVSKRKQFKGKSTIELVSWMGGNHSPVFEHLSGQDFVKDQVVASSWAKTAMADRLPNITGMYRYGETPTRDDLVKVTVRNFLAGTSAVDCAGLTEVKSELFRGVLDSKRSLISVFEQLLITDIDRERLQKAIHAYMTGCPKIGHIALLKDYAQIARDIAGNS